MHTSHQTIASVLLCCILMLVILFAVSQNAPDMTIRNEAFSALQNADLIGSRTKVRQALKQQPHDVELILAIARLELANNSKQEAANWLDRLPEDIQTAEGLEAWNLRANLELSKGRATDARRTLEAILEKDSRNYTARSQLGHMLSGFGFPLEAVKCLRELPENERFRLGELILLANYGNQPYIRTKLERLHQLSPGDPLVVSGLLTYAWKARDHADVQRLLNNARSDSLLLHHRIRNASLDSGAATITTSIEGDKSDRPDAMLAWAQDEIRNGVRDQGALILKNLIEEFPWSIEANHLLADLCGESEPNIARRLYSLNESLRRISRLARQASEQMQRDQGNPGQTTLSLIDELASVGRHREAHDWQRLLYQYDASAAKRGLKRLDAEREQRFVHPGRTIQPMSRPSVEADSGPDAEEALSDIHFVDVAEQVELTFQYQNGSSPGQEGLFMHQWTGGGIAVLDYDRDTWPDVFLTQGGSLDESGRQPPNQLFRNLQGVQFSDSTTAAVAAGLGFGQGVAAGDFNGDGFEDVYVANVGSNRLMKNMGDGTFSHSVVGESTWTTSVAIADVTGDSIPDIYDVNYLSGPDIFDVTCDHDGVQRICGPTDFPAGQDVLYVGNGAGGFQPVAVPPATGNERGMGVLVGPIDGTGRTLVYVANDESANRLLRFAGDGTLAGNPATQFGVAYGSNGQAQGSMGIAFGDFDSNGLPDLFVTNYYSETNNLFSQRHEGVFVDSIHTERLAAPGFRMLGFGAQFVDADSDGTPELIVANGHLDDFRHQNKPYRMKPQLFRRSTTGHFTEMAVAAWQNPCLGRAVARTDWNRDNATDVLIGTLDSTTMLLENRTLSSEPSVNLTLVGTQGSRIPIGACVTSFKSGRKAWQVAGDGYQCRNETILSVPVPPDNDTGSTHEVRWTSGVRQRFRLREGHFAVIEGRSRVYLLPL